MTQKMTNLNSKINYTFNTSSFTTKNPIEIKDIIKVVVLVRPILGPS